MLWFAVPHAVGDGYAGVPDRAPYDAIHVGAAAKGVPDALKDQLKPGGRMILPVEDVRGSAPARAPLLVPWRGWGVL